MLCWGFPEHFLPVTFKPNDFPGGKEVMCFELATNLRNALSAPSARQILFSLNPRWMIELLPVTMILSSWKDNVQYFEERLNASRHNAIARPSLETFHPLTLLRRNIADLEDAVIAAKRSINDKRPMKEAFEEHWKATNNGLDSLDDQYDALLRRIKTLSELLSNEIQLVIASVTVQVSISWSQWHYR